MFHPSRKLLMSPPLLSLLGLPLSPPPQEGSHQTHGHHFLQTVLKPFPLNLVQPPSGAIREVFPVLLRGHHSLSPRVYSSQNDTKNRLKRASASSHPLMYFLLKRCKSRPQETPLPSDGKPCPSLVPLPLACQSQEILIACLPNLCNY
jgi:hypothetical protein